MRVYLGISFFIVFTVLYVINLGKKYNLKILEVNGIIRLFSIYINVSFRIFVVKMKVNNDRM